MPRDVFRFINELDAETVGRIATRLEYRATELATLRPGFNPGETTLARLPGVA